MNSDGWIIVKAGKLVSPITGKTTKFRVVKLAQLGEMYFQTLKENGRVKHTSGKSGKITAKNSKFMKNWHNGTEWLRLANLKGWEWAELEWFRMSSNKGFEITQGEKEFWSNNPKGKEKMNERIQFHKWSGGLPMKDAMFFYIVKVGKVTKLGITNNMDRRMEEHSKDKKATVSVKYKIVSHEQGYIEKVEKMVIRRMKDRDLIIEGHEWTNASPEYVLDVLNSVENTMAANAA